MPWPEGWNKTATSALWVATGRQALEQSIVKESLSGGGFEPAVTESGEEAVTLPNADKTKYRALMTDINLG